MVKVQVKNFKLLAIKVRQDCSEEYSNNLSSNQLYRFYKSYEFEETNGQITSINNRREEYNIFNEYVPGRKDLSINVSAILGKNGSGKSTITELLFLSCYLIAIKSGLLEINEKRGSGKKELVQLKGIEAGLKLEIYYEVEHEFVCLIIDNLYETQESNNNNITFINVLNGLEQGQLQKFFYSIAVNYSIYGLNEAISGAWVGRLFHKNDGYRTPVVINPFRENGNINVGGEMHFAQTRLLSNLMLNSDNRGEILPGKSVRQLHFILDRNKIQRVEGHAIERITEELEISSGKKVNEIFDMVYLQLTGSKVDEQSLENPDWRDLTIKYVIGKLIRIASNYPEYSDYFKRYSDEDVPGLQKIKEFIKALNEDRTHITLKLRQALNFYKFDPLKMNDKRIVLKNDRLRMPVKLFAERIDVVTKKNAKTDPMEFIPIAPFTPRLILNDRIEFHKLSSGEQQYIHSLQAVIYHILNVNSVFNSQSERAKVTYRYINIVLDEIELYFHPEFQRRFVKDLLKTISNLKIPHIKGINILMLTHSPFILSDIPVSNVLRLENGKVNNDDTLTFAGNIHQMLASSFFMDSTTGDFSNYQCQEIIKFYDKVRDPDTTDLSNLLNSYKKLRVKFTYVISQIGEPVIKGVLHNHLDYIDEKLKYRTPEGSELRNEIKAQIDSLTQKLRDLDA
jgi:predicted ATPase